MSRANKFDDLEMENLKKMVDIDVSDTTYGESW
jgi:hypothetical protein